MKKARRKALRILGLGQLAVALAVCWTALSVGGIALPGSLTAQRLAGQFAPGLLAGVPGPTLPPGQWDQLHPTAAQVETAVAILTHPDFSRAQHTTRYTTPVVRYRLELEGYPASYLAEVRAAFAWVGTQTGLSVTETTGAAEIVVVSKDDNGAFAQVHHRGGVAYRSRVQLGCCRVRAAWEDLSQAFGATGDRGGTGSVFSNTRTQVRPSDFDAWVLHFQYQLPPNADEATVRAALRQAAGLT